MLAEDTAHEKGYVLDPFPLALPFLRNRHKLYNCETTLNNYVPTK